MLRPSHATSVPNEASHSAVNFYAIWGARPLASLCPGEQGVYGSHDQPRTPRRPTVAKLRCAAGSRQVICSSYAENMCPCRSWKSGPAPSMLCFVVVVAMY